MSIVQQGGPTMPTEKENSTVHVYIICIYCKRKLTTITTDDEGIRVDTFAGHNKCHAASRPYIHGLLPSRGRESGRGETTVWRPASEVARLYEHPPLRDINSAEGLMNIKCSLLILS